MARYRLKIGTATGPSSLPSLPGRSPKPEVAKKPKVKQCPLCFESAQWDRNGKLVNLGPDGRCADRAACEARQPVMF